MKRGARFSNEVIAFALTERSRRKRWKDIQNAIKQEFQIEPPTERQMRRWYEEYGGGTIDRDKLLRETLIKSIRASTPALALAAQDMVIEKGLPVLMAAYERIGSKYVQKDDPAVVTGLFLLLQLEQNLEGKFDEVLRRYHQLRAMAAAFREEREEGQPKPEVVPPAINPKLEEGGKGQ